MNNNCILGFADRGFKYIDRLGYKNYKYITAGVLLIDLKTLKKKHITDSFIDFINITKIYLFSLLLDYKFLNFLIFLQK